MAIQKASVTNRFQESVRAQYTHHGEQQLDGTSPQGLAAWNT